MATSALRIAKTQSPYPRDDLARVGDPNPAFLDRKFPIVPIIRATETDGAAMGTVRAFTNDGLFIGQSGGVLRGRHRAGKGHRRGPTRNVSDVPPTEGIPKVVAEREDHLDNLADASPRSLCGPNSRSAQSGQ